VTSAWHLADDAPPDLDRAAVAVTAAPLERSRTLPSAAYVSPAVWEWEQRHFFDMSWACVGRSAELARAGDQMAVRAGLDSILLVRDEAGALRGFYNACRHRGHELVECGAPVANRKVVKCPYHSWVYGLDGANRATPRFGDIPGFDRADFPLIPARVAQWRGWIFVNGSGDAPSLQDHVGNLEEHLAPYEPERLLLGAAHHYEVRANWKTITENYHECYHCPSIHPELCQVTPTDSGRNYASTGAWVGGDMALKAHAETMSLTGRSRGEPLRGLGPDHRRRVLYVGLLPNLLLSLHPDYVMTHRLQPTAPDRTLVDCQWLFPPEALERHDFDPSYASDFWDVTNRQDWRACESVARGLASRGHRPGPFSRDEDEVHQFMSLIARGYIEGRPGPPAPRRTSQEATV
jgi:phenylpropionate dioxygenase-like ring-hydroxylating dioxygenase large terminal subunit